MKKVQREAPSEQKKVSNFNIKLLDQLKDLYKDRGQENSSQQVSKRVTQRNSQIYMNTDGCDEGNLERGSPEGVAMGSKQRSNTLESIFPHNPSSIPNFEEELKVVKRNSKMLQHQSQYLE